MPALYMACMPCTAWTSHAAWDVAEQSALVEEGKGWVAEYGSDAGEEGRALSAVSEPMVEGDRQGGHPARFDPLLRSIAHDPRPATDLAQAQDAGLPWVQDWGAR